MPRDPFHEAGVRHLPPELPVPDQAEDTSDPTTEITVDIPSMGDEPIAPLDIEPGEPPVRRPW